MIPNIDVKVDFGEIRGNIGKKDILLFRIKDGLLLKYFTIQNLKLPL